MQSSRPELLSGDNFIIAGPLNLDRRMMRADTVMGERLQLSPLQFRALLMLVSNEGEQVPFEELHMFMTMPGEEKCSIHAAREVIDTLVNIVNISGRGFAKINVSPNDEYVFVTKWGMDWRVAGKTCIAETKKEQDFTSFSNVFSKTALSLAMAAALLVFIGTYFAFQASNNGLTGDDGLVYIPLLQIPLAEMPDFERSVSFPYVRGGAFYVGASHGIYVDTFNIYGEDVVFMVCLSLAESGLPLSRSFLVPRGEATNDVYLFGPLEPGRHSAWLNLRAFCASLLTEFDSMSIRVDIFAN